MKKCLIVFAAVIALLVVVNSMAMANPATTVTENVSVNLLPGTLSIVALSGNLTFDDLNVGTVIQHGFPYTWPAATAPSFTVTDATGSGDGWHVIFNCTQLLKTDNSGKYLQVSFNQNQGILSVNQGMPCDGAPTWNGPATQVVNVPNLNSDTTVVVASELYGMGQYDFATTTNNYYINLDATNTFVGKYTGTFTASLVSGPGGTGSWTGQVQ